MTRDTAMSEREDEERFGPEVNPDDQESQDPLRRDPLSPIPGHEPPPESDPLDPIPGRPRPTPKERPEP